MRRTPLDSKATQLRALEVFRDCRNDEMTWVSRLGDLATVPAGSVLVREGRPGTQFLVVVDGQATVTRAGAWLASLGRGDFFGEVSLLTGRARNATVTAVTPLTVLAFEPRGFAELLRRAPRAHHRITAAGQRRLQGNISMTAPTLGIQLQPFGQASAARSCVSHVPIASERHA